MDLSARYFDILKDRLYTSKASGRARRSAQTVLHEIARDLLQVLAPVMSFTAEEAWQTLPGKPTESVFLAGFPEPVVDELVEGELLANFEKLFAVRGEVQKLLEVARRDKVIGASLEAKVVLSATGAVRSFLEQHQKDLPTLLIVSQVELGDKPADKAQPITVAGFGTDSSLHAEIRVADGQKCPRCWTYSTRVGQQAEVCAKCEEALAA
jgi:isoleucyl-tRNA synthetase